MYECEFINIAITIVVSVHGSIITKNASIDFHAKRPLRFSKFQAEQPSFPNLLNFPNFIPNLLN